VTRGEPFANTYEDRWATTKPVVVSQRLQRDRSDAVIAKSEFLLPYLYKTKSFGMAVQPASSQTLPFVIENAGRWPTYMRLYRVA